MTDLRELYQEVILDHNRHPRNFRQLTEPSHHAQGYNPLCGDQLILTLVVKNGMIEETAFVGKGCAISTASASLMTEAIKGKSVEAAQALFHAMHKQLTSEEEIATSDLSLGKLAVFSGVKAFPARVKCATLAWHTLQAALRASHDVATTE